MLLGVLTGLKVRRNNYSSLSDFRPFLIFIRFKIKALNIQSPVAVALNVTAVTAHWSTANVTLSASVTATVTAPTVVIAPAVAVFVSTTDCSSAGPWSFSMSSIVDISLD